MHAVFSHFANDQLDLFRSILVAVYIIATLGVVGGVILEGKRFSEAWQDNGWLLLVIALSVETLSGGIIFWVDAEIQTRLGNDVTTLDRKTKRAATRLADTERKQVAFEKTMLPRRFHGMVHSKDEPLWKLLMALKEFAGTTAYVQVVPDFEAKVLANDLVFVLHGMGWTVIPVDEATSKLPSVLIREGVTLYSRDATAGVAHKTSLAAEALAKTLTTGGLGVSEFPVPHFTVPAGQHRPPSTWDLRDDPPDNAVFIAVGVRPITDPLALLGVGLWEIPKSNTASPTKPKK